MILHLEIRDFLIEGYKCSTSVCLGLSLDVQILFVEVFTAGRCPSNSPLPKQRVQHRHFQSHVPSLILAQSCNPAPLGMFIQVMPGQSCNSLHNVRNLYSTFIPHSTVIFKTPTSLSKWQIPLLIKYFYPASHQTYVEPSKQGKQRFVVLFFAMYKLKYMQMCTIYTDDATITWYLTCMQHSVMECFPSCLGS